MGFGHRGFIKIIDPRASPAKIANKVLHQEHKLENKLFDLAKELESIALNDAYFVEKKLYPNVDFYSGIILKAMGFLFLYLLLFLQLQGQLDGFLTGTK